MSPTPAQMAINALRKQAFMEVKAMIPAYYEKYQREEQQQVIDRFLSLLEQLHQAIGWIQKAQAQYPDELLQSPVSTSDENTDEETLTA